MSEPPIKFIRHQHMNLPKSPLFATYAMVEYYHYSYAVDEIARLKAEVERLKMDAYRRLSMRIEIDKLNAAIERLTNAGNAMADEIKNLNEDISRNYPSSQKAIADWNAAKERKDSR